MGGRGARGARTMPNGSGKRPDKKKVKAKVHEPTLREALGKKGEPIDVETASKLANPNYKGVRGDPYTLNCQRCVAAYEMRRRGYDVEALPNADSTWNARTWVGLKYRERYGQWMGAFRHASPMAVGSNTWAGVLSNVDHKMKEFGSGSRAVLTVTTKSGNGHVFNVENVNGRTTYIEAQSGKIYQDMSLMRALLRYNDVTLTRTDNLRVSDRMKHFVKHK